MPLVTLDDIVKGNDGSIYELVFDGFRGNLVLRKFSSSYFTWAGTTGTIDVRTSWLNDPQDNVDGRTGPGYLGTISSLKHRLTFWIDFSKSPGNLQDDQRFDGYFFTQTKEAMAGVTWSNSGVPFGFYARFVGNVIG
jgi:hypothetical protein